MLKRRSALCWSMWKESTDGLERTFLFADFKEALGFVVEVGRLGEAANHHPDIDIRWNKVHLALVTHDAGDQVTEKDRLLAEQIDSIGVNVVHARANKLF